MAKLERDYVIHLYQNDTVFHEFVNSIVHYAIGKNLSIEVLMGATDLAEEFFIKKLGRGYAYNPTQKSDNKGGDGE